MSKNLNVIAHLFASMHETAIDKGFWDTPRNFGECIALVHSEISEALEAHRTNAVSKIDQALPEWVEEFADTFIRMGDMLEGFGMTDTFINILQQKMGYNQTRPKKHGKDY